MALRLLFRYFHDFVIVRGPTPPYWNSIRKIFYEFFTEGRLSLHYMEMPTRPYCSHKWPSVTPVGNLVVPALLCHCPDLEKNEDSDSLKLNAISQNMVGVAVFLSLWPFLTQCISLDVITTHHA